MALKNTLLPIDPLAEWICRKSNWKYKRECLDHIVILNENHLRSILKDYISYYNNYSTHLANNKDSPEGREVQVVGKIEKIPVLNGLHNVYYRKAA